MVSAYLFAVFSALSTIAIASVLSHFIPFISRLDYPENDSNISTYLLFTIDMVLVVLFMLQHSLCASKYIKDTMEDLGASPITRSVYILYTAIALGVVMYLWQPILEVSVWMIDLQDRTWLWLFFTILHCSLWVLLFLQVLVMEPLHFIGIKQVYTNLLKQNSVDVEPMSPRLIRFLRHMPHVGAGCFIALLWLHPYMTLDRLILATLLTAYLCCTFSVSDRDYEYMYSCSFSYSMSSTYEEVEVLSHKKVR